MKRSAKLRSRQRGVSGAAMIGLGVYVAYGAGITNLALNNKPAIPRRRRALKLDTTRPSSQIHHRDGAVAMVGDQRGFAVGRKRKSHGIFAHFQHLLLAVRSATSMMLTSHSLILQTRSLEPSGEKRGLKAARVLPSSGIVTSTDVGGRIDDQELGLGIIHGHHMLAIGRSGDALRAVRRGNARHDPALLQIDHADEQPVILIRDVGFARVGQNGDPMAGAIGVDGGFDFARLRDRSPAACG